MITDTRPLDSMWPVWYDRGRGTKTGGGSMNKRKMGLIGPIIKDTYQHQCNSECQENIHMIKKGA